MSAPPRVLRVSNWHTRQRWSVLGLAIAGAALFALAFVQPWWTFTLFAPQYPEGLKLIISLTGVTGDVSEINIINHYIGMGHLDDAAQFERAWGGWMVGALGVAVVVGALALGKRLNWVGALAALGLPVGFCLDTMYWLYRFGHDLDPKAPIHLAAFTPTLFGEGKVGQFTTIATPGLGFWLAVAGVVMVAVAGVMRQRVCNACPTRNDCHTLCAHGLVGVPK